MKRQRKKQRSKGMPRRAKHLIEGFVLLVFLTTFALPVMAAAEAPEKPSENAGDRLAKGVGDTAMGWTEAPKDMIDTTKDSNIAKGLTVGTIRGAGNAVVRTTKGAVDTATFYIPKEKNEGGKEQAQ